MKFEVRVTAVFREWVEALDDELARRAVNKRLARIEKGNFGDHASLGDGLSELRIHYRAGYRIYYTLRGGIVVIIIAGGTKRTQSRDIARAKRIAKEL